MSKLNKVQLEPGRYVLAVSGGVDSMVLLDLLASLPGIELIVAHFDHGIRADSTKDEELVRRVAEDRKLTYMNGQGNLGPAASEDQARTARYNFLKEVKSKHKAKSIITAHHQDDLIETAIINVLRGSGRRGLTAIKDNAEVIRPLIDTPKADLKEYALANQLEWREDSTNADPKYLRNYIRRQVMPKLSNAQRRKLLIDIDKVAKRKNELDELIATLSHNIINRDNIDRSKFAGLPTELSGELMSHWLRQQGLQDIDRRTVERLSMGIKTSRPNTELVAGKGLKLVMGTKSAHFSNR